MQPPLPPAAPLPAQTYFTAFLHLIRNDVRAAQRVAAARCNPILRPTGASHLSTTSPGATAASLSADIPHRHVTTTATVPATTITSSAAHCTDPAASTTLQHYAAQGIGTIFPTTLPKPSGPWHRHHC